VRRKQIVKSMKGEKEGGTEEGRVGGMGEDEEYCKHGLVLPKRFLVTGRQ
jgi:hypothetical protein